MNNRKRWISDKFQAAMKSQNQQEVLDIIDEIDASGNYDHMEAFGETPNCAKIEQLIEQSIELLIAHYYQLVKDSNKKV